MHGLGHAWISAFVEVARHQKDGNSGEDVHVFRIQIVGDELFPRLFYKYRIGDSLPWYPRPFQIGERYEDQLIVEMTWKFTAATKDTTPHGKRVCLGHHLRRQ